MPQKVGFVLFCFIFKCVVNVKMVGFGYTSGFYIDHVVVYNSPANTCLRFCF